MKSIIKTIFRATKAKKVQSAILFLLIMISGILFSYSYTSVNAMKNYSMHIKEASNLEDFRFMVKPDYENKISDLEKKYNIEVEKYVSKFLQEEWKDKTINIYMIKERHKIDKPQYICGSSPSTDIEIAISKNFAEENSLNLNDKFKILGKEYSICGIYTLADKLTIYDTSKSVNINTGDNVSVILNDHAFNEIDSLEDIYYSGVFKGNAFDKREEVSKIAEESYVSYAISSEDYSEVNILDSLIKSNKSLLMYGMGILIIIIVIVVLIQLANTFKSFLKPVGVLIAIGCSKIKILLSYLCYSIIFGVPLIAGLYLGYIMSDSFLESINKLYNVNILKENISVQGYILCFILETLLLTLCVILMVGIILRKDALQLIKCNEKQSLSFIYVTLKKIISIFNFKTRIKLSMAIRKPGRFILGVIVFFISYNLLGTAFAIFNSTANITKSYKDYLNFENVYYFKAVENKVEEENVDKFIDIGSKLVENNTTSTKINSYYIIEGINSDQKSINLKDNEENNISNEVKNGVIIPKIMSIKHNISKGDKLKFDINGEDREYEVSSINSSIIDEKIYINIDELYSLNGFVENDCNGIYVRNETRIDKENQDISYGLSREDLINISMKFSESTKSIELVLVVSAVLISFLLIILISVFNFNDNVKNIALLNFMGYSHKRTNSMVVNVFDSTFVLGVIFGVLSLDCFLNSFENILLTASNYPITFEISFLYKIVCIFVILLIYSIIKLLCNIICRRGSIVEILRRD